MATTKFSLLSIDATADEAVFAARSIKRGYNDIVSLCAGLDTQIANLTAQRAALQPELDAATSLAAKLEAEFPPAETLPEPAPPAEEFPSEPVLEPYPVEPHPVYPPDDPNQGYIPDPEEV